MPLRISAQRTGEDASTTTIWRPVVDCVRSCRARPLVLSKLNMRRKMAEGVVVLTGTG